MGGLPAQAKKAKKKFMPVYAAGGMAGDIDPEATAKIKELQSNLEFRQKQYAAQQAQQGPQMAPQQQQAPNPQQQQQAPQMAQQGPQMAPPAPMAHGGMMHFEVGGMADQDAMLAAQAEEERRKQALLQSGAMDQGGQQGNFAPAQTAEVPVQPAQGDLGVTGTTARPLNPLQQLRDQQKKLIDARMKALDEQSKPAAEKGGMEKFFRDPANAFFLNMISPSLGKAATEAAGAYGQKDAAARQAMLDKQKLDQMRFDLQNQGMSMQEQLLKAEQGDLAGQVIGQDGNIDRAKLAQLPPELQRQVVADFQARRKAGLGPAPSQADLEAQRAMGENFENPRAKALWAEAQRMENMGDSERAGRFFQAAQSMEDKFHGERSRKEERAERAEERKQNEAVRQQERADRLDWQKQQFQMQREDRNWQREQAGLAKTAAAAEKQFQADTKSLDADMKPFQGFLAEHGTNVRDLNKLIDATSGITGAAGSFVPFTAARDAQARLDSLQAARVPTMPRTPGQVSNFETKMIQQSAGTVADRTVSDAERRRAAANIQAITQAQQAAFADRQAWIQRGGTLANYPPEQDPRNRLYAQMGMGPEAAAQKLPTTHGGYSRPKGFTDEQWSAYIQQNPNAKASGGSITNDMASMRLAVGR